MQFLVNNPNNAGGQAARSPSVDAFSIQASPVQVHHLQSQSGHTQVFNARSIQDHSVQNQASQSPASQTRLDRSPASQALSENGFSVNSQVLQTFPIQATHAQPFTSGALTEPLLVSRMQNYSERYFDTAIEDYIGEDARATQYYEVKSRIPSYLVFMLNKASLILSFIRQIWSQDRSLMLYLLSQMVSLLCLWKA